MKDELEMLNNEKENSALSTQHSALNKPAIRFKGFSGEWEERYLRQTIKDIGTGKSFFIANIERTDLNKFPILGSRGVIGYDYDFDYSGSFILTARVGENAGRLYKYSGNVKITDNTVFIKSDYLDFVFYLLVTFDLRRLAFGTGQPLIKASELNGLKLFFPLYHEEQTAIGNTFQQLDALINQHQQKHQQLNNLKKAMLEKMFPKAGTTTPEIRFKGFSREWKEKGFLSCIDRIIDFRGRTPKKLGLSWSPAGYRALSALNVKQGYIDFSIDPHFGDQELYDKWMSGSELHQGQVLFTTEAPMGNVAQVPNTDKYILSQRTIAFVINSNVITEEFLAVLLRSPEVFHELSALSSGGTAKGVSQKVLANLNVLVSKDLEEQTAIGNYFQKLDALINQHQQQLTKLANIKQACLSKMFV